MAKIASRQNVCMLFFLWKIQHTPHILPPCKTTNIGRAFFPKIGKRPKPFMLGNFVLILVKFGMYSYTQKWIQILTKYISKQRLNACCFSTLFSPENQQNQTVNVWMCLVVERWVPSVIIRICSLICRDLFFYSLQVQHLQHKLFNCFKYNTIFFDWIQNSLASQIDFSSIVLLIFCKSWSNCVIHFSLHLSQLGPLYYIDLRLRRST